MVTRPGSGAVDAAVLSVISASPLNGYFGKIFNLSAGKRTYTWIPATKSLPACVVLPRSIAPYTDRQNNRDIAEKKPRIERRRKLVF